ISLDGFDFGGFEAAGAFLFGLDSTATAVLPAYARLATAVCGLAVAELPRGLASVAPPARCGPRPLGVAVTSMMVLRPMPNIPPRLKVRVLRMTASAPRSCRTAASAWAMVYA